MEAAALDPRALLIFSGGQTRAAAGPRNEGWSYYRVAEYFDWWGYSGEPSCSPKGGAAAHAAHNIFASGTTHRYGGVRLGFLPERSVFPLSLQRGRGPLS